MPQENEGEKMEFLRREEIRTMEKDMARLREEEAKKERERILALQNEKKINPVIAPHVPEKPVQIGFAQQPAPQPPKESESSSRPERPEKEKVVLIPPPYKPPSRLEKILVRIVLASFIMFLAGNAIALGYYFFWRKDRQTAPPPQQQEPVREQIPSVEPESEQPISLINESNTVTVEYADVSKIPELLSDALKRVLPVGFTRVVLQNQREYAATKTILSAFFIVPPQETAVLLENNITPFVFFSNGKNHLGFVMEVSNQEQAIASMSAWEKTMERDTENLFGMIGEKGMGYVSFFRETFYKQTPIRFQTLSNKDFGIVYALSQNRLLLTESLESMRALIDNSVIR